MMRWTVFAAILLFTPMAARADLATAARQLLANCPPGVKMLLRKSVLSRTTIIPGVLVISHREAFIRGEVIHKNVFDVAEDDVDKQIREGTIKPEFGPPLHHFFRVARILTPQQRSLLVDMLNNEAG
jgi:hypothetical protein